MTSPKQLLLGDEAIARGALDAGVSGVYSYPGTPATEILEYVQSSPLAAERNVHRTWSANEKTALEAALGMSYAGKRAMAAMKHVGLNVASDPFMNSAITGVNGGLVVVSADDPAMHSSQNEQDNRFYGQFAMVPIFEPASPQEAYDMTLAAFDMSEAHATPVLLRAPTRLVHSRADISCRPPRNENPVSLPEDYRQFVLVPRCARENYAKLIDKQEAFLAASEASPFNAFTPGTDTTLGIIAAGIASEYLLEAMEAVSREHPILKIGQYPLPVEKIRKLADAVDRILVLEEGAPFIESMLRGMGGPAITVSGRLDGTLPRAGELSPDRVAAALTGTSAPRPETPDLVADRPAQLCDGCPHTDSLNAIIAASERVADSRIFSDIGCYALGLFPPFNMVATCVNMGATITMAKGAADAGVSPVIAVIGDSTFAHSGLPGLLDAIDAHSPLTVVILDNSVVAMTGGQLTPSAERLEQIVTGLGVAADHVRLVEPVAGQHDHNTDILVEELSYEDVSVVLSRRACVHGVKDKSPKIS